ncbi:hypothetical protein RRG08_019019 [Elysia crispata]|uniref:Uncharacterized protein n=1 Tax=Elysia crispata TaxID=231223 RepID=A0AAE1DTT7_9GAST|nr:hypothetical protein RRG08_019019 [Elysia crispata]
MSTSEPVEVCGHHKAFIGGQALTSLSNLAGNMNNSRHPWIILTEWCGLTPGYTILILDKRAPCRSAMIKALNAPTERGSFNQRFLEDKP